MQPKHVSKKAILNMLPTAVFCVTFWLFGAYAFFIGFDLLQISSKKVVIVFWLLIVVVAIFILSFPYFYWRCYRYNISEKNISLKKGIFWRTTESVPLNQVQQISVIRSPIDRITGLRKIKVTTAGGDMFIRFLSKQQSQSLECILKN